MKKWEEKFEKLINGEFDDRIDELKQKVEEKKANREEYSEYQKLSKSKENVKKVENIIEYRDKVNGQLEEVKKELQIIENLKKANEGNKKLEEDMKKIESDLEKVNSELKNKKLDPKKIAELETKKAEILAKRDDNNKKYVENQKLLKTGLNRNDKLAGYSKEKLEQIKLVLSSRVSKCNMVAKSLVNGLSWDSIDLKLDNWQDRKLTNKGEKLSRKEKTDNVQSKDGENIDIISSEENYRKNEELRKKKEQKTEFENKHPRLAKIGNWFKNIFKKDKMLPPAKDEKTDEKTDKDLIIKDESFKEFIKVVADKGLDGIEQEKKLAKQQNAKEKLAELRKANRANEAKKFGQNYADKSDYRNKDDDGSR
ncbi:MAG: hypothetical protein IJE59_01720 [Clostridia bacterium]|nr:hypothetical protein [Clostridia bacterium]